MMMASQASSRDQYFSNVSLLLHAEGANGGTTFIDSSQSMKTPISAYGGVTTSTLQKKFGASSAYFSSSGQTILYAHSADLHLNGDFTIEFFIFPNGINSGYKAVLVKGGGLNIAWASYEIVFDGTYLNFAASSANSGYDIGAETGSSGRIGNPAVGAWSHVAVTRSGNVYRGFVNGVMNYSETSSLTPYDSSPRGLAVGSNYQYNWGTGTPTFTMQGFLDELRITKGVARYTSNFTPPSGPFPNR